MDDDTVTIPPWLAHALPTVTEPATIDYHEGEYICYLPHGEHHFFHDLASAYDYLGETHEVEFTDRVPELRNNPFDHRMVFGDVNSNTGTERLYISMPDAVKRDHIAADLLSSYHREQEFVQYPHDFVSAYNYVKAHPAFWVKPVNDSSFMWERETCFYVEPLSTDTGYVWTIEHGGSVPPEYTTHYHDIRLDSSGDTVEEAYIAFAHRVYECFQWDGVERPQADTIRNL